MARLARLRRCNSSYCFNNTIVEDDSSMKKTLLGVLLFVGLLFPAVSWGQSFGEVNANRMHVYDTLTAKDVVLSGTITSSGAVSFGAITGTTLTLTGAISGTEIGLSGVAGTGKVVCVKADGNFGVCSDDPDNTDGTCTCG